MSFIYTPHDVRKQMVADPKHRTKWALVLAEFDKLKRFSFTVEDLGLFTSNKASDRGVTIDTGASDIATAARWAKDGFRKWAALGIDDADPYFAKIAREWAKSESDSSTRCLGSTVDFLYLFSRDEAEAIIPGTNDFATDMYPRHDLLKRDMVKILLWVFVNWWEIPIHPAVDIPIKDINQSDLHPDYLDSGHPNEDQTHHFALYFYVGVKAGANMAVLIPVLNQTDDLGNDLKTIINPGDYYLGITAAKLGNDFEGNPRFMGDDIASTLRQPSPEKWIKSHARQSWASLWIDPDGKVAHPESPAGNGGLGRFASAGSLSGLPKPGELPHPNSPAARTLDQREIDRDAPWISQWYG